MKREEINDWLQVLGLAAVAISLVFVGYELKLSREIAMADIYQQRTALGFQLITESTGNETYVTALGKLERGENLTDHEEASIAGDYLRWLTHWENLHFQYQLGLITQEQWSASLIGLRSLAAEKRFIEGWQNGWDSGWRASYVNLINSLITESDKQLDPKRWWKRSSPGRAQTDQ